MWAGSGYSLIVARTAHTKPADGGVLRRQNSVDQTTHHSLSQFSTHKKSANTYYMQKIHNYTTTTTRSTPHF